MVSNYKAQCAVALLRARARLDDMRDDADEYGFARNTIPGYEELQVAIVHLEELYGELKTC